MTNKLDKMVGGYAEPSWTPNEMAAWIDTLGRPYRISTIDALQKAQSQGQDIHQLACELRRRVEMSNRTNCFKKSKVQAFFSFINACVHFISEATIGWAIGAYSYPHFWFGFFRKLTPLTSWWSSCQPFQMVCQPGWPSPLRPRNPPSMAMPRQNS
jgi:hypothetical protein